MPRRTPVIEDDGWQGGAAVPDMYKTVYEGGSGELIEKKSRFIATVRPVHEEAEALAFIEEMRKKYWDARHNCYAYTVGKNREYTRASDDGEPSQTAGRPMLDVLLGEDLYDTAVVVTRYFGGILLGTGGLVRAYSGAVQEGLRQCVIIEKRRGVLLEITTDYNGYGKLQYITAQNGYAVLDTAFTDNVVMKVLIPSEEEGAARKAVTEGSNGRAGIEKKGEMYFAKNGAEVLTFEEE